MKHQSRVKEKTSNGTSSEFTYQGTYNEMLAIFNAHVVNEYSNTDGRLKSIRLAQEGAIWTCQLRYETGSAAYPTSAPSTNYGEKSASLSGSMLSMPLESHPSYRTNWNYFLAGSPNVSAEPAWWTTATDTVLSFADAQNYLWVKSPGECPVDAGGRWRILKQPTMKGVESYDLATYTVTESARFGSASAAGEMVANNLNLIGSPDNTFGITGGNWKCDSAGVAWSEKYWLATLTWTRSGDSRGWNTTLYNNSIR